MPFLLPLKVTGMVAVSYKILPTNMQIYIYNVHTHTHTQTHTHTYYVYICIIYTYICICIYVYIYVPGASRWHQHCLLLAMPCKSEGELQALPRMCPYVHGPQGWGHLVTVYIHMHTYMHAFMHTYIRMYVWYPLSRCKKKYLYFLPCDYGEYSVLTR